MLQQAFSTDASSNKAAGIANRRFVPDLQEQALRGRRRRTLKTDEGYKHASRVPHRGRGLHVNSTSQRAWEATLLGLKKAQAPLLPGQDSVLNNSQTAFSASGWPAATKSHVDDCGSVA